MAISTRLLWLSVVSSLFTRRIIDAAEPARIVKMGDLFLAQLS
jgi:hypothetical protein